jgi:hypothetical protein
MKHSIVDNYESSGEESMQLMITGVKVSAWKIHGEDGRKRLFSCG